MEVVSDLGRVSAEPSIPLLAAEARGVGIDDQETANLLFTRGITVLEEEVLRRRQSILGS